MHVITREIYTKEKPFSLHNFFLGTAVDGWVGKVGFEAGTLLTGSTG
jgi:hypothetical protein